MLEKLIQFFKELLGFGPKPSGDKEKGEKIAKWEAMRRKMLANQTAQRDELENLKDQIRDVQSTILTKETERNASSGEIRNIVEREIKQLFTDVEKFKGRQEILFRHLDTNSTTIAKIEELVQGLKSPTIEEGVIDILINELEDLFDKLRDEDHSLRELNQVQYKAPVSAAINVDEKLAEFHQENPNLANASRETQEPKKTDETAGPETSDPLTE